MIHLIFSDVRITTIQGILDMRIKAQAARFDLGDVYPDHRLARKEIPDYCDKALKRAESKSISIITDSDFILNEFRIRLKQKRLLPENFRVFVEEEGKIYEMRFDSDGRADFNITLLNMFEDQLMRLL